MATYTVGANDVGVWWTMTASAADTVNFTGNVSRVQVINEGTVPVYVTVDGSTPSVPAAGASTRAFRVPAGMARDLPAPGGSDAVKLISSGTPTVTVEDYVG